MVTEERQTAPYAPVANVLTVIRRLRERGLPDPLTFQELERIGVPAGNAPRTLAALRFLRLVNDSGSRTEAFEQLGRASTADYPATLAEILREAYRAILTVVDPAEDNEIALHDAFRHYEPQAQRGRMVTLFLGLCQEAGVARGGPPERRPRRRRGRQSMPAAAVPRVGVGTRGESPDDVPTAESNGTEYRLLAALMQQLPRSGTWTRKRRDKWIEAMTAGVDLLIETVEEDME